MHFSTEFFLRHHLSRFASDELQHVQPAWFYVPVLLAGLLPWTPVPLLAGWRAWREERLKIPLWVLLFGFLFFSISRNKLPGYLLPLLPSFCILCGAALERAAAAGRALFWTVMLASLAPAAAGMLPEALLYGVRRAEWDGLRWEPVAALLPAALLVWRLEARGRRITAAALTAALACAAFWYVRRASAPALDELVSARGLWRRIEPQKDRTCILRLHRTMRYGLAYYAGAPLPDCSARPAAARHRSAAGGAAPAGAARQGRYRCGRPGVRMIDAMKDDPTRRQILASAPLAAAARINDRPALLGGTPVRRAPFPAWPVFDSREEKALLEDVALRALVPRQRRPRPAVRGGLGAGHRRRRCLATCNGTSALFVALNALDVQPGDEVIVPPYTFIATVNVVLQQFALPVFVDTDPETFQMDASKLEAAITGPRTAPSSPCISAATCATSTGSSRSPAAATFR